MFIFALTNVAGCCWRFSLMICTSRTTNWLCQHSTKTVCQTVVTKLGPSTHKCKYSSCLTFLLPFSITFFLRLPLPCRKMVLGIFNIVISSVLVSLPVRPRPPGPLPPLCPQAFRSYRRSQHAQERQHPQMVMGHCPQVSSAESKPIWPTRTQRSPR